MQLKHTPLMEASSNSNGHTNIASYLIKKGADIDLQDIVSESYIVFDLN